MTSLRGCSFIVHLPLKITLFLTLLSFLSSGAGLGSPESPLLDSFYAHGGSDVHYGDAGAAGGGMFGGGLFGSLAGGVMLNEWLF